jgi:hypothetical protein
MPCNDCAGLKGLMIEEAGNFIMLGIDDQFAIFNLIMEDL